MLVVALCFPPIDTDVAFDRNERGNRRFSDLITPCRFALASISNSAQLQKWQTASSDRAAVKTSEQHLIFDTPILCV